MENVIDIREILSKAKYTPPEELITFLLDEGEKRYQTKEERRAFIFGGVCVFGFYLKEIRAAK